MYFSPQAFQNNPNLLIGRELTPGGLPDLLDYIAVYPEVSGLLSDCSLLYGSLEGTVKSSRVDQRGTQLYPNLGDGLLPKGLTTNRTWTAWR